MNTPMHLTLQEVNALKDAGTLPQGPRLTVGDRIAWRHGWGLDAPRMTRVKRIEIDCNRSAEDGESVQSCTWEEARKGSTVVDLDNGHWAYGDQIYPDMLSAQAKVMPTNFELIDHSAFQPPEARPVRRADPDEEQ